VRVIRKKLPDMKQSTLALVLVLVISGCKAPVTSNGSLLRAPNNRKANGNQIPRTAIELSATDLFQAFQENRSAADANYKGKTLVVTGAVFGRQVIEMHEARAILVRIGEGRAMVTCAVVIAGEDPTAMFKVGEQLKVQGHCDGFISGTVAINDCTIK
jgi:hypothetical protein